MHLPNYGNTVQHLRDFIDPRAAKRIVQKCKRLLEQSGLEFTSFAFRGLSGALIAPLLAAEMDKTLLAVRKVKSDHGGIPVEGDYNAGNYIIVDDFISSGKTCRAIMEEVDKNLPHAKCIAVLQAYYFDHKDMLDWAGYPDILCTSFPAQWNEDNAKTRIMRVQREKEQREREQQRMADYFGRLQKAEQYQEQSYNAADKGEATIWGPPLGLNYPLGKVGLPPLRKETPKKLTEKRKAYLSKLERDRANFNARTATDRPLSYQRITRSSLRNTSR